MNERMNQFITEISIPYTRGCALYKYALVIHKAFFNHRNTLLFTDIILHQYRHIVCKWCIITYYVPNNYIVRSLYSYNEMIYMFVN